MHALIPVFEALPATNQSSLPIPAHYARAGSCVASYSGTAQGTLKVQASHDGQAWVDIPEASIEVDGPGSYLVSWQTASPFVRVRTDTSDSTAQNEVQRWNVEPDDVASGTFTVSDGTTTSAPVDWELLDGPALLWAALEEVYGTGNILWADPEGFSWEFVGALSGQSIPLTIVDVSQLVPDGEAGPISDEVVRVQEGSSDPGEVSASVFLSGSRS